MPVLVSRQDMHYATTVKNSNLHDIGICGDQMEVI